ncbi:PREDICTED: glutamic acid-rich protein-like [Ipomoea nil]|uniref:glutamic acid-rich protein-like n=1 Tax=Ipomoea nil TaxID=35883 RepID=UPI000901A93B|nr:PREDICTED: glutamic acid-rich protein-like [Ipomoea nil]
MDSLLAFHKLMDKGKEMVLTTKSLSVSEDNSRRNLGSSIEKGSSSGKAPDISEFYSLVQLTPLLKHEDRYRALYAGAKAKVMAELDDMERRGLSRDAMGTDHEIIIAKVFAHEIRKKEYFENARKKKTGYDKQKASELGIPIELVKAKRKSRTPKASEDDQPKPKRQKREKRPSRVKGKNTVDVQPLPTPPKSPQETKNPSPPPPSPEPIIVKDSSEEDNLILSRLGKRGRFRSTVKIKHDTSPKMDEIPKSAQTKEVILTQEPALVDETTVVPTVNATIPKEAAPIPEATVPLPTRDQVLPESIESDYQRVLQWQKWRTAPLGTFIETFEAMQDEEQFALQWIGIEDVYKALRLEEISRVFSYKMTNRTLGKDKAPICIELKKPPLDPAVEEEMKQLRYALLLSKIKTTLEKEHQNDPNCNTSGSKDELGREIEEDESNEDEENEDNDDKDVEDADDEHDDDDDDDDNNDDDNMGNNVTKEAEPDYDSQSPLLIGPDYETYPQSSPLRKLSSDSDETREASHQAKQILSDHPEDMSRAIVPHFPPMDETPIK